jgi:GTP-binding protein
MIKFADETTITVASGNGGNGCIAFRREKYVPFGGPSGGDGGRGGDVIFEVRRNLRTLAHLRYAHTFKARNGQDGMGRGKHGADGDDVIVAVPPGTVIKDVATGALIKDFADSTEQRSVFLKGGNGGWGNVHFKSSTNQAPRTALPGKPGQTLEIRVELQLMADIGLVGLPNAGKSSLLDRFTNARPKIAPYPFTTKLPNLGVLTRDDRDIILADIPGIIAGAHEGAGLGIRFLKHISRTAALAVLIDLSDDGFLDAFDILMTELRGFSDELTVKPRIVLGTKTDLPETAGRFEALAAALPDEQVLGMSVFSGAGLEDVAAAFLRFVCDAEKPADRDPWSGAPR